MTKPCKKCGATDRCPRGDCIPCAKAYRSQHKSRWVARLAGPTLIAKPCIKCGATDRYPSGACRPCSHALNAKRRVEHTERIRAEHATWYAENVEQIRVRRSETRAEHREEINANKAKQYAEHPEIFCAYKHKRRSQKLKAGGSFSAAEIRSLLKQQKRKCVVCGVNISKTYHIDHIMPLTRGGHNGITNIQLLCPHCNLSKRNKHPVDFMQSRGFLI